MVNDLKGLKICSIMENNKSKGLGITNASYPAAYGDLLIQVFIPFSVNLFYKGKPKVAIDYNALFVRMVKKYNKHHKDNPLPHITPHTLRHTFCTRLASKNMNPKDLQYIMGHNYD